MKFIMNYYYTAFVHYITSDSDSDGTIKWVKFPLDLYFWEGQFILSFSVFFFRSSGNSVDVNFHTILQDFNHWVLTPVGCVLDSLHKMD